MPLVRYGIFKLFQPPAYLTWLLAAMARKRPSTHTHTHKSMIYPTRTAQPRAPKRPPLPWTDK